DGARAGALSPRRGDPGDTVGGAGAVVVDLVRTWDHAESGDGGVDLVLPDRGQSGRRAALCRSGNTRFAAHDGSKRLAAIPDGGGAYGAAGVLLRSEDRYGGGSDRRGDRGIGRIERRA